MSFFVRMTDSFMSGWGGAQGKKNVYVVECDTIEQAEQIEAAALRRGEMKRVMIVDKHPRPSPNVIFTNRHYNDLGGPWKA